MAETDALLALRNSIGAKHAITFLNDSNQPSSSLAEANALVLPQTDGGPAITLPKSTPTRLRKPGHTETDPLTHPMDFYTLDAVFLAWSLRGAATAEYMKTVRESGIILTNMVAITEKQSVVEWLEGRIDSHPNIVSHGAPSAVTSSPQKKRYVPDTNDVDAVKRIKQKEVELRDRNTVLRGSKQSNFSSVRNLINDIEALSKFGADAWDRVICVLTTGQAWQFRAYKWSEPRELFHRVKGFYVSWANDAPNPKVKDWNVTELKIDPNKRHLDKSTVAQFWKTLDSWIGTTKPNLLT
ncbi:accessory factor associated with RNA polymerase II [Serendipita sp. 400]|nr:accessory factor associated with RNA polymerase II [Serendipita sp. 400]